MTAGAEEGYLFVVGAALYGDKGAGMDIIKKVSGGQLRVSSWIRGWVSMMVMCEVLKTADKNKELTGPGIRKYAEQLTNLNTQGLTAPITYSNSDHRPFTSVILAEFAGGKMVRKGTIDLPRRADWKGF